MAGHRPVPQVAPRPHGHADPGLPAGQPDDLRRARRAAACAEEPGDGRRVAALPRAGGAGAAGGGQPLLHGVPLHAAAAGRLVAAETAGRRGPAAAATAAQQVARHRADRRLLLLLRVLQPVGDAVVDRLGGAGLLRRRVRRRHDLPRRGVLQIRLPAGPVQLLRLADLPRWRSRCDEPATCDDVPHQGLHSAAPADSRTSSGHRSRRPQNTA